MEEDHEDEDEYDDDDDEELDDSEDYDDDDDDDEDAELDDISESELEEMAASTRRSLFMVQMQLASQEAAENEERAATNVDDRNPRQRWHDFVTGLVRNKVLKLTDAECNDMQLPNLYAVQQEGAVSLLLQEWIASIQANQMGLTHVILGGAVLKLFAQHQSTLFQAFWFRHCTTLTYLKLGTSSSSAASSNGSTTTPSSPSAAAAATSANNTTTDNTADCLDLQSLVSVLQQAPPQVPTVNGQQQLQQPSSPPTPQEMPALNLTELELCKVSIDSSQQIASLQQVLSRAQSLKQLNLLGMHNRLVVVGLLDPILSTVSRLPQLDECRLSCVQASPVPLVSATCLARVLVHKPKWWRLGLDGVGLDNEHVSVLAQAMSSNEACKAGDLLSLTLNPAVTHIGWNQLFVDVLFHKQRMGLVKVDEQFWQATFNLVRSMNNLHGRLGYFLSSGNGGGGATTGQQGGSYASRLHWIEWLAKLSQISWEDEAHKVNYLWFTLLERPDFIHQ